MSALPRALLLDLDDTILDVTGSADRCWQVLCAEAAPALGLQADALSQSILSTRTAFWNDRELRDRWRLDVVGASRLIVGSALETLGIRDAASADAIANAFRDRRDPFLCPFPGATETLAELRAHGIRLALLTNGAAAWQRAKLERFGLAGSFDCVLIEGELGYGKPDARIFEAALSELGHSPADAWMIGDNLDWDIAGAQGAGITGIWLDFAMRGLPERSTIQPDRIITALVQLLREGAP